MNYLADAHREWHYVNGKYAVCPLDCGVGEQMFEGCNGCGTSDDVHEDGCQGDAAGVEPAPAAPDLWPSTPAGEDVAPW